MENPRKNVGVFLEKFQSFSETYHKYAKANGLNYITMAVLEIIYEYQSSCTQKLICELSHYPKQSVNLVIKSFLENGYIEMQEQSADRRNKIISFTDKGRRYAQKIVVPFWETVELVVAKFGEEQFKELVRLLDLYGKLYCEQVDTLIQEKSDMLLKKISEQKG